MNERPQSIKQATIGIALLVLMSKGIGFLREIIIAYRFGTTIEYDVYLVAVSIPIALYTLSGYTFSNLFIPNYSQAISGTDKRFGLREVWADFNLTLLAAVAAMLLIIAIAPQIICLIAPGLDPARLPEASLIIRISAVIVVLAVFEAFFRSVLNAEKHFLIPAAGPILANVFIIGTIILFSRSLSTLAILYGLVAGYLAQTLLVYFPFRKTKILSHFHPGLFRHQSGRFISIALILLMIDSATQLYAIIDRYFASGLEPGIVSALGYCYLLIMLPVAIVAYALSTALFPYITDAFVTRDHQRGVHLLNRGITVSLLLALPVTMLIWVFADKIVILLFRRGAFDMQSVTYTSTLLKYMALGLCGQFIIAVMSRPYYATRKYWILAGFVIVALITKAGISIIGVKTWGYLGLAVASSISYSAAAVFLLFLTGRIPARIDATRILMYFIKVLVATAAGYAVARLLYYLILVDTIDFSGLIIDLPAAMVASIIVVLGVGYILRISDIHELPAMMRRKPRADGDKN